MWSLASGECIHELNSSGNKFQSCVFHPGFPALLVVGGYQVPFLVLLVICQELIDIIAIVHFNLHYSLLLMVGGSISISIDSCLLILQTI